MIAERVIVMEQSGRAADMGAAGGGWNQVWIGVIGVGSQVRFLSATASRQALERRIAAYVTENLDMQLYRADARKVRDLIARGALPQAIELYFNSVGERWDAEWLEIRRVGIDEPDLHAAEGSE